MSDPAHKEIEGFVGPKFSGEEVLCTGCWDASNWDIHADNDVKPGEPVYYWKCNEEYDEWDAYCAKCAEEKASEDYSDYGPDDDDDDGFSEEEEAELNCGRHPDGQCDQAGSEYCDLECPYRD